MAGMKRVQPSTPPSNVIPMRQRQRKAAPNASGRSKIISINQDKQLLDLQVGLALLGTDGKKQFYRYLEVRHTNEQRPLLPQAS